MKIEIRPITNGVILGKQLINKIVLIVKREVIIHRDIKAYFLIKRKKDKDKPWRALLRVGGKSISLGYYSNPVDAAKAYNNAATKHCGDFAKLNKIKETKT